MGMCINNLYPNTTETWVLRVISLQSADISCCIILLLYARGMYFEMKARTKQKTRCCYYQDYIKIGKIVERSVKGETHVFSDKRKSRTYTVNGEINGQD